MTSVLIVHGESQERLNEFIRLYTGAPVVSGKRIAGTGNHTFSKET
ncbi:hypothetical protein CE91St58_24700 [Lachnospiraceae bacterium]|nr:hypothetical protein CE91St58_24700 [Lachnospiraceae bacterium]